jgi:hypothetical protein
MAESIIDGLLITLFSDMGPAPLANSSSLDEVMTMKLAIAGMTILSMGTIDTGGDNVYEQRHFRLHGPIPVPDSAKLEALAMSFKVSATDTADDRVADYGRETTLWIIFSTEKRNHIYQFHGQFETTLKEFLSTIKSEKDLERQGLIDEIMDKIRQITAVKATVSQKIPDVEVYSPEKTLGLFTVDNEGILVEIESLEKIYSTKVILFVNSITKTIFNIMMDESISQRFKFLAGRAASNMNTNQFRSEFQVRDVSDDLERQYLMEKIEVIFKEFGSSI